MNLLTIIFVVAIGFALLDVLCARWPKLQNQIFGVAILVIGFLYTIKYYYGPDIYSYVPFYEDLPSLLTVWRVGDEYRFEWGYTLFCAMLKGWGVSFWQMTAIISVTYFLALYLLFRQMPAYRTVALSIISIVDYTLITCTYRQALSVAFFIFMVLSLRNRRYIWAAFCAIITIVMHKSGIFAVAITVPVLLLYERNFSTLTLQILLLVLLVMLFVPLAKLGFLVRPLPLPGSVKQSIIHHLTMGKQFQVVFLLYFGLLVMLEYIRSYYQPQRQRQPQRQGYERWGQIALVALCGLALLVIGYQYFYLLNRMRSYFLPFVLTYSLRIVWEVQQDETVRIPYVSLLRQGLTVLLFLYLAHYTYTFDRMTWDWKNPIYKCCTVFDLRHQPEWAIRNHQWSMSDRWWQTDYKKMMSTNRI